MHKEKHCTSSRMVSHHFTTQMPHLLVCCAVCVGGWGDGGFANTQHEPKKPQMLFGMIKLVRRGFSFAGGGGGG